MNYIVRYKSGRNIEVALPASKSITNRMLIINALADNKGELRNIAECDDTDAMLNAFKDYSAGKDYINIGAAGTAMRFLTAYFALRANRRIILDGSQRMRQRPIMELVTTLKSCGADIEFVSGEGFTNTNCPPLKIVGRNLSAKLIEINGGISSQYISAIMMIAPYIKGGLIIKIKGELVSRPYVEMTATLMNRFGAKVSFERDLITIAEGGYKDIDLAIESDWSAASYWYELKALLPNIEILLSGLNQNSCQGDSRIAEYFTQFGVTTEFTNKGVRLGYNSDKVTSELKIDLSDQPDLAQTFAVTACLKNIPFEISGLSTLKIKETDRVDALISQLAKLGYIVKARENSILIWNGEKKEKNNDINIETFKDHRMAMAFAPAAIMFPEMKIVDAGVVTKSYPDYWSHLQEVGFILEEE